MDLWSVLTVALTLVILGFLYWRMIKREVPERIGAFQAILPFGLGILSMLLYGPFIMWFIRNALTRLSFGNCPPFVSSLIKAFLTAGGTEEALKLIFILITLALLRSRVKNVYEYVLIGAAVGAGFTVTEEFLYADEGAVITLVMRMITVAAHMAFNMIMAEFLGKARVSKQTGKGSSTLKYAMAFIVPTVIHTVYDACTVSNSFLLNEDTQMLGLAVAGGAYLFLLVFQIIVLIRFRKKTNEFCAMSVL